MSRCGMASARVRLLQVSVDVAERGEVLEDDGHHQIQHDERADHLTTNVRQMAARRERQTKDSTRRACVREALSVHEALELGYSSRIRAVSSVVSYPPAERAHRTTRPHKLLSTPAEAHLVIRHRTTREQRQSSHDGY